MKSLTVKYIGFDAWMMHCALVVASSSHRIPFLCVVQNYEQNGGCHHIINQKKNSFCHILFEFQPLEMSLDMEMHLLGCYLVLLQL